MKETRFIMGMPVTLEVADKSVTQEILDEVFAYFVYVDEKFSIYKKTSEISAFNRGEISEKDFSDDMKTVFALSEETKRLTSGYFDIHKKDGSYDTNGLVKGWAILNAAKILEGRGMKNFYVNVGGDVQFSGLNGKGEPWRVGIQNPFNRKREIIKTLHMKDLGIATSGTYVRGNHIYNPKVEDLESAKGSLNTGKSANDSTNSMKEIVSLTVIGPNVYEADRFATASFAMGKKGIKFIENLEGFEGYMIDTKGIATMTSGFSAYTN